MLRVALCLGGGFCLITAWMSGAAGGAGGLSGGRLAAVFAVAVAVGCFALALAPADAWQRVFAGSRRLTEWINRGEATPDARTGWVLAGGALVAGVANLACFFPLQQNPWDDDQGAYLLRAEEIQSEGGTGYLFRALFSGQFDEANRQPLYPALLSFRPEFDAGKLLSAAIGMVTLLLTTILVSRRLGAAVAGLFAVFLASDFAFCFFSTRVVSEVLMVLFSGLTWLMSCGPPGEAGKTAPRRSVLVGAILGLAWLSKATGLLLLIGTVIWSVLEFALDRRSSAGTGTTMRKWAVSIVCLCGAFLAVGSPLIVRNVRRFGNPFYNVNSLLLFADSYQEFDGMVAAKVTTPEAARQFFATHTVGDVARREMSGLVWELFIILRSLGPTPLDDSRALFGAPLALLALATIMAARRPEHRLLLVWGVLHWVVFAWYVPIAAGERFVMPLLIPILVTAGEGVMRVWPWEKPRSAKVLMILGVLWLVVWVMASYAGASWLVPRLS